MFSSKMGGRTPPPPDPSKIPFMIEDNGSPMAETDYRLISQEYAKGGISAVILVNSGAAVALLSQLSSLSDILPAKAVGFAFISFVIGIVFGLLTWVYGFISTRHVDRVLRLQDPNYSLADRWMFFGLLSLCAGVLAFAIGCILLSVCYLL